MSTKDRILSMMPQSAPGHVKQLITPEQKAAFAARDIPSYSLRFPATSRVKR
jgi:hypothetical protein